MQKSLLIIGAGASKDFHDEFLTGEDLMEELKKLSEENQVVNKKFYSFSPDKQKMNEHSLSRNDVINFNSLTLNSLHISLCLHGDDKFLENSQIKFLEKETLLEILLQNLLVFHNPESIDYYLGNDLMHHIGESELKKFKELKIEGIETLEDLKKALTETAKQRIAKILFNIQKQTLYKVAPLYQSNGGSYQSIYKEVLQYNKEQITNSYFYKIIYKIGLDSIDNLEIITFNYDLVLEGIIDFLIKTNQTSQERIEKLKNLKNRIIHVYGNIVVNYSEYYKAHLLDLENNKIDFIRNLEENFREKCKDLFIKAHNTYFLGFAFDKYNIHNLGLNNVDFRGRKIFITNSSKAPLLEYIVSNLFKDDFKTVKEGSRKNTEYILNSNHIYISEKTITESLKTDFFF